ncbi:MAG: subclass B3 metallo-beta-lactamase [Chitinophagaceae bacterium]|nr:MAG: subclass B3 metallo-beta-lactamase [Chitinophagaceae bacterium]
MINSCTLRIRLASLALTLLCLIFTANAQGVREPANKPEPWTRPYPAFRIAGNLYYVGTYDLACYLLKSDQGLILINTGVAGSDSTIKRNIESLGFNFKDIRILLTTQAHYDHVGAMAAIQQATGAKVIANAAEASAMKDGGKSDYEMGGKNSAFVPLRVDAVLQHGDSIRLGNTALQMLHHPGHTKGSCSYLVNVKDSARSYRVLIANMPTIISDRKFSEITAYPEIEKDFANTLSAMTQIQFDLWLASHASQFDLHKLRKPGAAYNPAIFARRDAYVQALSDLKAAFDKKRVQ